MLLKMMALIIRKALKILLTMDHEYRFSSTVLVGWYKKNSLQIGFSMSLNVQFNLYGAFYTIFLVTAQALSDACLK